MVVVDVGGVGSGLYGYIVGDDGFFFEFKFLEGIWFEDFFGFCMDVS